MDLMSTKQFERLEKSIAWADLAMETPRRNRIDAVRQYVGSHYSDHGAERAVPTNFLKMAVDIFVRRLAPQCPRVLLTSRERELRPTAATLEARLNQLPKELGLSAVFKRLVTEALFSPWGIAKVGLAADGQVMGIEYGKSFVDIVTLDDYFCDLSARRPDLIEFEGNSYWVPYEELMDGGKVPQHVRPFLAPDPYTLISESGQGRADAVSVSDDAEDAVYRDKILLRDVWVPSDGLMVTYAVTSKKQLHTAEQDEDLGAGPYHKLSFNPVPGSVMPLSQVAVWRDLHELGNALFRKLANQADAEKTVLGFPGGDDEGVQNFKAARDGDGIKYTAGKPEQLTAGGVNQVTLAFYLQCRDLYSYFGGNLDSLGGLSPQTDTVGQDKLLNESANALIKDMSEETAGFIRGVFRKLAHYEWNDPVADHVVEKQIPGTDMTVPGRWNRSMRKGKLRQYELDVDVYSLQDDSPSAKLQRLGMVMQQYIMPLAPLIESQGGTLDVQTIIRLVGKYSNLPELEDVVQFLYDKSLTGKQQSGGTKPPNTTRTYDRVTRPGASQHGKSQILQQALLGGKPQQSEVASLGRPTG